MAFATTKAHSSFDLKGDVVSSVKPDTQLIHLFKSITLSESHTSCLSDHHDLHFNGIDEILCWSAYVDCLQGGSLAVEQRDHN